MNLIAVLVFMLAFGVYPMWTWLLFPLVLLPLMVLFTAAVATGLSALYVRCRDVGIIWSVVTLALFYGSADPDPDRLRLRARPGRDDLSTRSSRSSCRRTVDDRSRARRAASRWPTGGGTCCPAAIIFVGVCVWSVWYFNREAPRIAEEL